MIEHATNRAARGSRLLLVTCALLAPLANLRLGGINFTAFDISVALLWASQVVQSGGVLRHPRLYLFGGLMVGAGGLSAIWAVHADQTVAQVLQWAFLLFIAVPAVYRSAQLGGGRTAILGITVAVGCIAVVAVWQHYIGDVVLTGGRYGGLFGDPQVLAFTLSCSLPYVVHLRSVSNRGTWRLLATLFAILLTGVSFWQLALTGSRTGLVAAPVGVLLSFIFNERGAARKALDWRRIGRAVGQIGVPLVAVALVVWLLGPGVFEVAERRLAASFDGEPGRRTELIVEAVDLLHGPTIVTGVGLENSAYHSTYGQRPHNVWVLFLVEGGLPFLAGFIGVVALLAARFAPRGNWRLLCSEVQRAATAASAASFVAFLLIALLNTQSVARIYWFSYAFALGSLSRRETQL